MTIIQKMNTIQQKSTFYSIVTYFKSRNVQQNPTKHSPSDSPVCVWKLLEAGRTRLGPRSSNTQHKSVLSGARGQAWCRAEARKPQGSLTLRTRKGGCVQRTRTPPRAAPA